ncbi:FecR family protein [Mucilaginibacter jinjuensis]|uniref:FecR domain-containing protein n=1 Tax=Mucilaginibacter jinjuensis TaxID=1176721 RepID=A0ABY7TCR8_9SPHI|nr:FecR family protein [Mucilaginibacter jinjuensis]WCT14251.1 FecR domain-containing protein [Mucilaginibacter jinjuensis]
MNYEENRILYLLDRYQKNTATPQELAELDTWYQSFENSRNLTDGLSENESAQIRRKMFANIERDISQKITGISRVQKSNHYLYALCAAILPVFIFILVRSFHVEKVSGIQNDVQAGNNIARLVLSNGSVIDLQKARVGAIYTQPGLVINKDSAGLISYHTKGKPAQADSFINTLIVPAGGQFRVMLADGTKIWMNAMSRLTYPVMFKDKVRPVNLSGEAYFEVAKNKDKPFFVNTAKQSVRVLGTHFDVNAYANETVQKTTLLEGSVQVTTIDETAKTVIIKPGQQSELDDQFLKIRTVNPEDAVGWKNGIFVFNHTELHDLMRQFARWYNIEAVYQGDFKPRNFSGEIERGYTLVEALRVLELGSVHFRIEKPETGKGQKRLIIMQ